MNDRDELQMNDRDECEKILISRQNIRAQMKRGKKNF
jgi:hypothetical protein